jgi:hypothetical protein
MVVMMNEFPIKNPNEKGLSDDRYVYLLVNKDGSNAEWSEGYRYDEGGATAPGFNIPSTPYNIIQSTPQSTLPDILQTGINKAYKSYGDIPNPNLLQTLLFNAIKRAGHN